MTGKLYEHFWEHAFAQDEVLRFRDRYRVSERVRRPVNGRLSPITRAVREGSLHATLYWWRWDK